MNTEVKNASDQTSLDETTEFIPAASQYALKLAFQSVKERYDKLQNRLYALEGENIKFKETGNIKQPHNGSGCSRMDVLEKKIDELSRQKTQLSHHIFVLANENKDLWSNISKLTEEKQILIKQLRELVDKKNNEENQEEKAKLADGSQLDNTITPLEFENNSEVSRKYYTDEENKESLLSIETVKDLSLIQFENRVDVIDGLNIDLKDILSKMNEDKVVLKQQQLELKEALTSMRRMYQGMKMYTIYLQKLKTEDSSNPFFSSASLAQKTTDKTDISETVGDLINHVESVNINQEQICQNNDEIVNEDVTVIIDELICPFCGKLFIKNTNSSQEYNIHFLSHVQNCTNNFVF